MPRPGRRAALLTLFGVACAAIAALLVIHDRPPPAPTFTSVSCEWRGDRVLVSGVMHARASGVHDYDVTPLFRLDDGRLEHCTDTFSYNVSQGQAIAWHEAIAPNWRGSRITYCSARGQVMVPGEGDD
jgi:hypothetical protein